MSKADNKAYVFGERIATKFPQKPLQPFRASVLMLYYPFTITLHKVLCERPVARSNNMHIAAFVETFVNGHVYLLLFMTAFREVMFW